MYRSYVLKGRYVNEWMWMEMLWVLSMSVVPVLVLLSCTTADAPRSVKVSDSCERLQAVLLIVLLNHARVM